MDKSKMHFEDKVTHWFAANARLVVGIFVTVLVLWGGFALYGYLNEKREVKAQNDLFAIESELEKKQQEIMAAETKPVVEKLKPGKKPTPVPPPKAPEKTPESLAKNYGSFVERFETFISGHKGTKAAFVAGIALADLYMDHKAPKKAAELLSPLVKQTNHADLFFGLLQSQLGVALSDAGDCGGAIKVFDDLLQVDAQKPFHSQSLLRKGACLVTLNKFDDAKATFEKARTEFPDSFTGEMAQGYERLVELRKGVAPAGATSSAQ